MRVWCRDLDVGEVEVAEFREAGGLVGGVVFGDAAEVGEDVTFEETT